MRHFLAQFGPALKWPWTKLTDVPELTDELVEKIAAQSDEQAAGLSIRELERIRDDNLVALLQRSPRTAVRPRARCSLRTRRGCSPRGATATEHDRRDRFACTRRRSTAHGSTTTAT